MLRPLALLSCCFAINADCLALTRTDLVQAVLKRYPNFSPQEKQEALAGLAARADTANLLLEAMAAGKIPRSDLSGYSARQIAGFKDANLASKLEKVWGKIGQGSDQAAVAAETATLKQNLNPKKLAQANLPAGRMLYTTTCGQCHVLFGEGGKLGPDLTGSNRKDLDYLLENIVDPNALIGRDYELHIFTLNDQRAVAGMVREESEARFLVQTLTTQETVRRADIAKHEKPGISMMPAGQLTAMTPAQQRDLIAYLQSPTQVPMGVSVPEVGPDGRLPGALEAESLKILEKSGNAAPQDMQGFRPHQWSGNHQLWWTGAKVGDKLVLEFSVPTAGKFTLAAGLAKAPDYATATIRVNDQVVLQDFDCWDPKVVHTGAISLGRHEFTAGKQRLSIEITGRNPQAVPSHMMGLDYLLLIP